MRDTESSPAVDLSIIVPLYNEEASVRHMYRAIVDALAELALRYEIIFVDDGSKDQTAAIAKELIAQDPRIRLIRFRRNYGQTPAMTAGIRHARGAVLITMDGDLQNDPRDIPEFLRKLEEGYDIVVGWRFNRQDKLVTRKIPSRIANWLIGKVTGVPIKDNGCSLKAYKAELIKNVPLYSEMHRFIPAMSSLAGARIAEIKVRHHARRFGQSKYGLSRIYKVILDLLTIKTLVSYSTRLFLWFSLLALGSFAVSAAVAVYVVAVSLSEPATPIVVPVGVSMLFAGGGMYLLVLGALSELIYVTSPYRFERLAFIARKDLE